MWLGDFLQLGEFRKGYFKQHVTPYMHCFAYHVPFFISKYGNSPAKVFQNGMVHLRPLKFEKDLSMPIMKILLTLKGNTLNNQTGGNVKYIHKEKKKKIQQEIQAANMYNLTDNGTGIDLESLTEVELQSMLSDLQSKKTRIRNRQKLINAIKELKYNV
jgi:hypothetical protein